MQKIDSTNFLLSGAVLLQMVPSDCAVGNCSDVTATHTRNITQAI